MVDYVETYVIDGVTWGIEDYEAPGDHFFPFGYKKGSRKRFNIWRGGGGCGNFDTLDQARKRLLEYATQLAVNDKQELSAKLHMVDQALFLLSYAGLTPFKREDKSVPRKRKG